MTTNRILFLVVVVVVVVVYFYNASLTMATTMQCRHLHILLKIKDQ